MNKNEINDKRSIKEFKGITFSGYKKSEAKKELIKSVINNKIENACYWSAEYVCSGNFIELWEIIFLIISKHIHLGNPKLPIYINLRLNFFKDTVNNGYMDNELKMRNNDKIRKLFAEIVSILCLSKKKNSFDIPKIDKTEYNVINISHRLQAKNIKLSKNVFKNEDPKELFMAINELSWNIKKKVANMNNAIYWVEWIFGFETLSKKEKQKVYNCATREVPVEFKFKKDVAWLIWEVIRNEASKRGSGIEKIVESLLSLYCLKYKPGCKRKRRSIIYNALNLFCEHIDNNIKIVSNNTLVDNITSKINIIYQQIKKNEIKPETDYLFNNSINSGNLEKTIEKLDKMANLTNLLPRK